MPGNEVGDRVHNFFDQGSLSQDQHHTQFVTANWSGCNSSICNANERQIGGPVNTGPDNYCTQQSDIGRGQANQFPQGPNGLNFARQNLRPEFVKNPSQLPQLNLNGFMHASQIGHTRQNQADFLGVDTEAGRHNMTSRSASVLDSQQRSGSQFTNSSNFGGSQSPMNFNLFGGQLRMNGQQPGMMQSLPQQQPGNNNTQLQQQIILKQMELQRQHQLQQFEAIQRSAATNIPPFPNQIPGQHPLAINGNPSHDGSSTNRLSASVPGYSNGFMSSPEQGQAMQFMALIPQQTSQSLYGLPVASSQSPNAFSLRNIDKPGMLQVSAPSSSFSANQYGTFAEQSSVKEGNNMVYRYESEGKSSFEQASSQHLGNMVNLEGFTQAQRNVPMSEGGEQGFAGSTELVTEKSVSQASSQGASTQAAVGLDPTEEKILFGNDDNTSIWEAFGGASLTESGDASDLLSGFPSMQSGTWSALMQSAVAETSSTDGGITEMQEDWSGIGSQNSRPQSGSQHPSVSHSNGKSQRNMVDSSPRASFGSHLSSNDVNIHNANTDFNYVKNLGQQQKFVNQRRDSLQNRTQTAQEGMRWFDRHQQKPHITNNRVVENSNSSIDFTRTDAGFWGNQQSSYLHNNDVHQSSQSNSSNFMGSVPETRGLSSINQNNLLDRARGIQVRMDTDHGAVTMLEPVPNSNTQIGNSLVRSNDDADAPGLSNMNVNLESSQKRPNNHHLDLWKSVKSSGKSEREVSGRDQHNLNKGPPILESSDNSPDGGGAEMHETENGGRRDSSSDGHHHSFPPNASIDSLRENKRSDSADRHSLPGGKEKSSGQAGKRGPVTQKFQYHPMGDVDVNLDSYATNQVLHSQSMSQHFPAGVKGQEVNPRFLSPLSTNITEMEGRVANHGPVNASHGVSGSAHPGYLPNISAAFVRSGEISSPNQHLHPSQNVLELLHKVDQSKEQNAVSHISSTDYGRLSDTTAGRVTGHNQSHLSSSHGFSLQLAPPSEVIAPSNLSYAVRSASRTVGLPNTGHVASEKEDKLAWLVSESSAQCLPPSHQSTVMASETEPGKLGNKDGDVSEPNLKDNSSISSLKSPPQSEHLTAPGGKSIGDQSATMAVDRQSFHDQQLNDSQPQVITSHHVSNSHGNLVAGREMNQSGVQNLIRPMPASSHTVMSGMSRKDNLSHLGNLWASQQHLLGAQAGNVPELLKFQFRSFNAPDTSFTQQKDEQDGTKRVGALSSQGIVGGEEIQKAEAPSSLKVAATSQEEPSARHLRHASPSCPTINKKDIEPLLHSENQNNTSHNNYSLIYQMQTMKSLGSDPSHRESKRLKSQDDVHVPKQIAGQVTAPFANRMNSLDRDLSCQTTVAAGDSKILNFSPQLGNRNDFQFPHGAVTSQDMLSFVCNNPQNFATGAVTGRTEHTGISPQVAPSWLEQYGTLKNGQLLPVHNMSRVPMKNVEQQIISGNSPDNLVVHDSVQLAAAATEAGLMANTHQAVSSLHALVPHVSVQSPASMGSKKRKTATSDLLSWNKEIGQCLKRLQNLSSAEVDWAQSSNRLIEKLEDETDNNEDILPMTRLRRRLILTTQLMQQVLQPPSAGVLSLDASSNNEVIVYSLARSVLGDACSLICGIESISPVESANFLHGKVKTLERIQDQFFSKTVKDFVSREKELENELLRLDKRASILDFRLDCQDLERFSVINRFARFHGRGQVDGAETSSSSDANATVLKPCPQRYVSAHPMPRNVPERVQCLSL